mmetsp:Transcript_7792/g.19186  ORF Transcript_7792/g.19186 Transcript_7792/m.19186 type:complete len:161 (+) Transcript_7792:1194-1676(+)
MLRIRWWMAGVVWCDVREGRVRESDTQDHTHHISQSERGMCPPEGRKDTPADRQTSNVLHRTNQNQRAEPHPPVSLSVGLQKSAAHTHRQCLNAHSTQHTASHTHTHTHTGRRVCVMVHPSIHPSILSSHRKSSLFSEMCKGIDHYIERGYIDRRSTNSN